VNKIFKLNTQNLKLAWISRDYYLNHLTHSSQILHDDKDHLSRTLRHATVRYNMHTHCFHASLSWRQSLCQKWELFFVEPQVKSQWTVGLLVGYLTISTVLAVIKHVVGDNIICLSATQRMHAPCTVCTTLYNNCCANFISPEIWPQQARAERNWLQDLGVYSSVNMRCKSTKLKKSSNDWLNSGKAYSTAIFEWKHAIFVFLCFPR